MWHCASMADGAPDERPSLEMPSLSLRRRRGASDDQDATRVGGPQPETAAQEVVRPLPEPERDRMRRRPPNVSLTGLPAAALTGVAVGVLAVLLAWLAGVGCEAVRGTSACGGGPGLLVLAVVLALLGWAGSLLLRSFTVPDAGSTSALAVGILAVLVLVFLLGSLDEWWALVAVPAASAVAFCGSWWVTTAAGD